MKINHKGIQHEILSDAPFISARISSISCKFGCKNCFNRLLLDNTKAIESTTKEIVNEILSNPFNQGIVFGGGEWTEQPTELLELIKEISKQALKIMIYTGCNNLEEFYSKLGITEYELKKYIKNDFYIKCGKYDCTKLTDDNIQFGIKLASENQMIYELKGDYL